MPCLWVPTDSSVGISMPWMLRLPANLFSATLFTSLYPTFRFKVWSLDGPSTAMAGSFVVYCSNVRIELSIVQRSHTVLRLPSNNARERKTVNIFRRPPFIGITMKETWACTISPTRNICGSLLTYLAFNAMSVVIIIQPGRLLTSRFPLRLFWWRNIALDYLLCGRMLSIRPLSPYFVKYLWGLHPYGTV